MLPTVDHIIIWYIDRCIKKNQGRKGGSTSSKQELLLSGVRRKLNREDDCGCSGRVSQPNQWLYPLTSVKSSPTRKGFRVGGGVSRLFSPGCSYQGTVCVIDRCFYLTACCLSCLLLCGRQQIALLEFGHVPMNIYLSVHPSIRTGKKCYCDHFFTFDINIYQNINKVCWT